MAVKEDAEKILRMIGWQVAAGVLFLVVGLEMAFSETVLHAMHPFEHGNPGFKDFGLEGFSANVLLVVGGLNLGVAASRFAKVLQQMDKKLSK